VRGDHSQRGATISLGKFGETAPVSGGDCLDLGDRGSAALVSPMRLRCS
jgi:hypothetical protein